MGFLLQRVNNEFLQNYFTKNEYSEYLNNVENDKYIDKKIYSKIKELNNYLKEKDFELFNFITDNIISFDQNNNHILKTYDLFFEYHQKILTIFFDNFVAFEKLIKNKIINSINYLNINSLHELIKKIINDSKNKNFSNRCKFIFYIFYNYNFEKAKEILKLDIKNEKENWENVFISLYEKSNKVQKRYFDYKLINEFSFSDIVDFFTILENKNYKNYLNIRDFIINLLGNKRYSNLYHEKNQQNIIKWFLNNYNNIRTLRNKVMHNKVLFTNIDELKKGMESLIKLSNQQNNIGNVTYKKFLKETFDVIEKMNQKKANKFFMNKIINLNENKNKNI
ncbi:/ / hypothetical protein / 56552:57568 Forward [Candidatus Hepatoplasma crinochetorum]|uniref:Uncharacterized protein n=1 Tax=Candidatus Hepatoplasma crinochetorum TaxID=295596 RepID=A0A0G7ZLZ2_9MOLU|nr:/ / hypothetical protein / 56552:57568 Forward [Candidatus Hepatoplasma crinochetorum]